MIIWVVLFDFHVGLRGWIVELGAESVDKVTDEIGVFDDSIEEDLNVIVLFSDWVGDVHQDVETFFEQISVVFRVGGIVHRVLKKCQEWFNENFVFLVVFWNGGSENDWEVNFIIQERDLNGFVEDGLRVNFKFVGFNFEDVREVGDFLENGGDFIEIFDLDFLDFFLIFEEGPKEVDDFDGFVFVGFLFVSEDFVDEIEESFKEIEDGFDFSGEAIFGHVEVEFDSDGDVD